MTVKNVYFSILVALSRNFRAGFDGKGVESLAMNLVHNVDSRKWNVTGMSKGSGRYNGFTGLVEKLKGEKNAYN